MNRIVLTSAFLAFCSGSVLAQTVPATPLQPAKPKPAAAAQAKPTKTLTVGDKAPAIEISHVLKGEDIEEFQDGHVYVVEFWATWCGPCLSSMPHLTEVQGEYEDEVTIIGISDEPLQTVVGFLGKSDGEGKSWNDKIDYTLTTDPDRSANTDYMKAAGQNGIPTAFIVGKEGNVEWIGHPMRMDEPLEQIVNDTWDSEAYAVEFKKEQEREIAYMTLMREIRGAETNKEKKAAIEKIDAVLKDDPGNLNLQMVKFDMLRRNPGIGDAYDWGMQVARDNWDSANLLNSLSWTTIDSDNVSEKGQEFAMKLAQRADDLTENKDPMIIDTLARCYFVKGDIQTAIKLQKKAVDLSEGGMTGSMQETLEEYEAQLDKA